MTIGIFGKHDSVSLLLFLSLPAQARRLLLRRAGTLDDVTAGMVRDARAMRMPTSDTARR